MSIGLAQRRQLHWEYLAMNRAAVCLGCGSLYWRVITDEQVEVRP